MKIFRIPPQCDAILFDLDSTLYTNEEYARLQVDLPIERLAKLRGVALGEMRAEMNRFRENWAREHEGAQISWGNVLAAFGISIEETIKWREELDEPERYLAADEQLRRALERLGSRFALAVVTNSPVSIAARTLDALGVEDLFKTRTEVWGAPETRIVGIDTCGVSKPHEQPLLRAAMLCGTGPESCVSVGDRYDIDIALPLELGMGGILVDGVKDVYTLPEMLP
jgi:phosphoglycolate phosphatase/putative hydrolase of the HAD superfamily